MYDKIISSTPFVYVLCLCQTYYLYVSIIQNEFIPNCYYFTLKVNGRTAVSLQMIQQTVTHNQGKFHYLTKTNKCVVTEYYSQLEKNLITTELILQSIRINVM